MTAVPAWWSAQPTVTEACMPFPPRNFLYEGPGEDDRRRDEWVDGIVGRLSVEELRRMAKWFLVSEAREAQQVLAYIQFDRKLHEEFAAALRGAQQLDGG